MARSSRGEDARFSFWKQGFDSPTGYKKRSETIAFVVFRNLFWKQGFVPIAIGTPTGYIKRSETIAFVVLENFWKQGFVPIAIGTPTGFVF